MLSKQIAQFISNALTFPSYSAIFRKTYSLFADCSIIWQRMKLLVGPVPPKLVFGEPPPAGIKEEELLGLTSTGTNVSSLQMKKEARDSEQWLFFDFGGWFDWNRIQFKSKR